MVNDLQQYADLRNQTNPLQWNGNIRNFNTIGYSSSTLEYKLQQNELIANDGMIGIFDPDEKKLTFLTTTHIERVYNNVMSSKRGITIYP